MTIQLVLGVITRVVMRLLYSSNKCKCSSAKGSTPGVNHGKWVLRVKENINTASDSNDQFSFAVMAIWEITANIIANCIISIYHKGNTWVKLKYKLVSQTLFFLSPQNSFRDGFYIFLQSPQLEGIYSAPKIWLTSRAFVTALVQESE